MTHSKYLAFFFLILISCNSEPKEYVVNIQDPVIANYRVMKLGVEASWIEINDKTEIQKVSDQIMSGVDTLFPFYRSVRFFEDSDFCELILSNNGRFKSFHLDIIPRLEYIWIQNPYFNVYGMDSLTINGQLGNFDEIAFHQHIHFKLNDDFSLDPNYSPQHTILSISPFYDESIQTWCPIDGPACGHLHLIYYKH